VIEDQDVGGCSLAARESHGSERYARLSLADDQAAGVQFARSGACRSRSVDEFHAIGSGEGEEQDEHRIPSVVSDGVIRLTAQYGQLSTQLLSGKQFGRKLPAFFLALQVVAWQ